MKKSIIFILLTLAAATVLTSSAKRGYKYESVKGDPTATRIYTLDNGLKVYMTVNKDKPRINAQVAVKVGSKNDPRETTGLAHYFEHLMFKGTKEFGTQNFIQEKPLLNQIEGLFEIYRKSDDSLFRKALYHQIDSISLEASKISIPNEYDKLMASIGASGTNAYTSYDVTCYVENIPSNQIETWAEIQSDRFKNCILRGFHTELETIYEEFNMYNAQDQTKVLNELFSGLFRNHPYNTDVIGLPSHLKNPSITNVRKYHDKWYVPNNMAVILSGDFNPDKAIAIIDRHFGTMEPNLDLRREEFLPEEPITSPVVRQVVGNESANLALGWRFPAANTSQALLLKAFSNVLQNGKAGLIDLDINQQQKVLSMYSGVEELADYCVFLILAEPKPGQTLDQCRDLALAEIEKVKKGDFDKSVLEATINNLKLEAMRRYENSAAMASLAVDSFINDIPWSDIINETERLSEITKEDIVAFANANFGQNYVQVNKLQGKPEDDGTKIDKPAITPIFTNRDTSSTFLRNIQAEASAVKPIEPSFLDFKKDITRLKSDKGLDILYRKNETNGTFELYYLTESGYYADRILPVAARYMKYLGTSRMSPEEVQKYLYSIACDFNVQCRGDRTYIIVDGLAENMEKAMTFIEDFIEDAQPNPEALDMLKANIKQERLNDKTDQNANFNRLRAYLLYGPENPYTTQLSSGQIDSLTDASLLEKIHSLFDKEHEILYYGPMEGETFAKLVNKVHRCPETREAVGKSDPFKYLSTDENRLILAPFDANQAILFSVSSQGEAFDAAKTPSVSLYNEYFGGGMNSIVFQEMREARGLAYSAGAAYQQPDDLEHTDLYMNMIMTQSDKLVDALNAFDEIINNMPVSPKAFAIAKESLLSNLRSQRTVKSGILFAYLSARKLGLDVNLDKLIYDSVQNLTLEDVVRFQQQNVKDRKYTIGILGRQSDYDIEGLSSFGKVQSVTTEEIFGY